MRRYHIHIHDGVESTSDPEGVDLPDDRRARQAAIRALCEVAMDKVPRNGDRKEIAVHVTDEGEKPCFRQGSIFDSVAKAPPDDKWTDCACPDCETKKKDREYDSRSHHVGL